MTSSRSPMALLRKKSSMSAAHDANGASVATCAHVAHSQIKCGPPVCKQCTCTCGVPACTWFPTSESISQRVSRDTMDTSRTATHGRSGGAQRPSEGERECAGGARGTVFGRGAVLTAGAVDRQVPHRVQARSSRAPEDIFLRQHAISDGGRGQRRVHALERRQRRKKTCPGRANATLIYKWRQLV